MEDETQKRRIDTNLPNPPMTNIVTQTMIILTVLLLFLINPTTTRIASIALHVPVTKGGTTACLVKETLNVSSGGLQSNPDDDILLRTWDVWLKMHSSTAARINHSEIDNHMAGYRNLDISRERSNGIPVYLNDDTTRHQLKEDSANTCGTPHGSYHPGDDTKGVVTTSGINSSPVLEVPPEPPPVGQNIQFIAEGAHAPSSTLECSPGKPCKPSTQFTAWGTAKTRECKTEEEAITILSFLTPAMMMRSSFVAKRPVQQAVVESHDAAESHHEGFKWTQWDVWLERLINHSTLDQAYVTQKVGRIEIQDVMDDGAAKRAQDNELPCLTDGVNLRAPLRTSLPLAPVHCAAVKSELADFEAEVITGSAGYEMRRDAIHLSVWDVRIHAWSEEHWNQALLSLCSHQLHYASSGVRSILPPDRGIAGPISVWNRNCHERRRSMGLQTVQKITEIYNIKLVGRGDMNASKEHDGDFRSWSRPGVKLPIDQNATGEESGATPSSSQQGSNKSRKEESMYRPWDTGSQLEASCAELEELQLHTWEVWDNTWLMMDIDEHYWGLQLARQSKWNIQAMHCNEMEMILRRLRALRAHCHLRLHERLNRQWNELLYWVEYRVPRGLRMTITRSSRLFVLALTLPIMLLLSSRNLVRAIVPSRKLSAGSTEEFSTCQRKCANAKILLISTPATTMSLSPVAIRPVQQAVVVSHVAAESDHEGFKWTQWDVWLVRFPGHPTIEKCPRRLAHPVRKGRRKEIPPISNLVLQLSLAVAIAASVIKHLKSRTGSTLASLTASATRLTKASVKFILWGYIEAVYGGGYQHQKRFQIFKSPLDIFLRILLRSTSPLFATPPPAQGGSIRQGNKPKKRSTKASARRASSWQKARRSLQAMRHQDHGQARTKKLSYLEVMQMINSRQRKYEEPSRREVEEMIQDSDDEADEEEEREEEREYIQSVAEDKSPLYGNLQLRDKPEDVLRFFSCNINGLSFWLSNNPKAQLLKHLLKKYQVDALGLQEMCINWSEFKNSQTLASLLRDGAINIKSVHSYNIHETENIGRKQRGGTAMLLRGELAGRVIDRGKDETGLGMWSWYRIRGEPGCRSRIVSAYAPTGNKDSDYGSYFKQIHRYIQRKGLRTTPKAFFREALCKELRHWRSLGDRLVLLMDANENVIDGVMVKMMAKPDIGLREAVHSQTVGPGPNTHIRGSQSIDGVWYTPELEVVGAAYLPFQKDLGDHRIPGADITADSLLGRNLPKVAPAKARRLNSKSGKSCDEYIRLMEKSTDECRIYDRLLELKGQKEPDSVTDFTGEEANDILEIIDQKMTMLMLDAEKKCRKLYAAHYEFSPAVKCWLDRCHAYQGLIRLEEARLRMELDDAKQVTTMNVGNIKRAARRSEIEDPLSLSLKQLHARLKECKEHSKRLMAESPWMRRQFLLALKQDAIDKKDEAEAQRIQQILRGEAQRKEWQGIHRVTKRNRAGAVTRLEVVQPDGSVISYEGKEDCERVMMEEIMPRFRRADSAPVCRGDLFELLGYSADTETAIQILEGTFDPPAGTDEATRQIFKEIGRIWKKMESGEVDIVVTVDDFKYYWSKVRERTASSISGRHFGHYKAAAKSDKLSRIHALMLSLCTRFGYAPDRWRSGLAVLLEKIAGVALVTKQRIILLLEADFNCHNKLIFGKRMLDLAREHKIVPDEIYSEKGRTAEDAILHQVLAYDIARQKKAPLIVASVDAAQCYDRMAHSMMALASRAGKVPKSSVNCMLQPLREMEFYMRTGYGESDTFVGGKENLKQGGAQGNGGAPAEWQQLSTVTLGAHKEAGHGVTFTTPISKVSTTQASVMFVDDKNLWAGLDSSMDLEETAYKAQEAINSWGNLLMATGGALQPPKCKWTVHHMEPKEDGTWEYLAPSKGHAGDDEEGLEDRTLNDMRMTVPQASGEAAVIEQLTHSEAVENLGLFVRPDGKSEPHLKQVRQRVEEWTALIKEGDLPTRSVWMSYRLQLWAGVKYGLGASSASMKELEEGLGPADFYLLSKLGVVRSISKELRYIPSFYGGVGLFDLTCETTAATLNSFLQHYGTATPLGIYLKGSLENLQLELGVQHCPFKYNFEKWGHLATDCWVKSLWEKISSLSLDVEIEYKSLPIPRERDKFIMEELIDVLSPSEAASFNRARIHQEAMTFADICTPNGNSIDPTLLQDWQSTFEGSLGQHRSVHEFGKECPCKSDWKTWQLSLRRLCFGSLSLPNPLGNWKSVPARIWRVFFNEEDGGKLEVVSEREGIVVYDPGMHGEFHKRRRIERTIPHGVPATVRPISDDTLKLVHIGRKELPHRQEVETDKPDFRDFLRAWGGDWMWEDLCMNQSPQWVANCLRDGNLVCVTDGSYNKKKFPNLCSAGWILVSKKTKRYIAGTLVERSPWANSFRGEMLGMLAIRIFLLAVEEYCDVVSSGNGAFCDCKGVITTFEKEAKRVSAGKKNGDILRVLRAVQTQTRSQHHHRHVRGHQDDVKKLTDLSFEAYLNTLCDKWAKEAILEYIADPERRSCSITRDLQRLPLEPASVFIEDVKQTTDIANGLRKSIGKSRAKAFCAKKGIFDGKTFDSIDWDSLEMVLAGKPQMYNLWYGKQCSDVCATGKWMKIRSNGKEDCRCPNCNMLQEDAAHLMVCPSVERTTLFKKKVEELDEWMRTHHTNPELRKSIRIYLNARGKRKFCAIWGLSNRMQRVAKWQDRIGWKHFTEGKVSEEIRQLQWEHLVRRRTRLTVDSWMKGFVGKLLEMAHTQWIFRCITKHHKTKGTKTLANRRAVLSAIENQFEMGFASLPPEDQWMLEIDRDELFGKPVRHQQFWVWAMQAARKAGARAEELTEGHTSSWESILEDENYAHLPTQPTIQPENNCKESPSEEAGAKTDSNEAKKPATAQKARGSKAKSKGRKRQKTAQPAKGNIVKTENKSRTKFSQTLLTAESFAAGSGATRSSGKKRKPKMNKEYGSLVRRPTARQVPSLETLREDRIGIFSAASALNNLAKERLREALIPPPIRRTITGTIIEDPDFISRRRGRYSVNSIKKREFATLREGVWLNDSPLNFFLKTFVQDEERKIHCFSSGFFQYLQLRNGGIYHYDSVSAYMRRQLNAYEEGIASLFLLFVPINIDNTHWIFLCVVFESKRIELFDSQGKKPSNQGYMETMRRFLYDEFHKGTPVEDRPLYDVWKREWKCSDRSSRCPRQQNDDDCGIFVIVNIYLMSRGIKLTPLTYDQRSIITKKVRNNIAHLILQKNELTPGSSSLPPPRTSGSTRRRKKAPEGARKRSQRRQDTRITPIATGTGIINPGTSSHDDHNSRRLPSSKRSAASLAEDRVHGPQSTQRQMPPAKKRKKKKRTAD